MRKLMMIMKGAFHLIRRNKVWFLMPILLGLALLAFLVYTLGPVAMVTFLYAGI